MIFTLIYLAGLISIMCWVVLAWVNYRKKHRVPEVIEYILGFALLVLVFFGGTVALNSYKNQINAELKDAQYDRCTRSKRKDGEYLTDAQCEYFLDVMNGKYTDEDEYIPTDY